MRSRPPFAAGLIAGALLSLLLSSAASAALWPFPAKSPAKAAAAPPSPPPAPIEAPPSSAPVQPPPAANLLVVEGFRAAHFGMTYDQVLAAIKTDFDLSADKVQVTTNGQEGTTLLTVTVPKLDPGHGPATITYVLGATSQTLIRVGVSWSLSGEPTREERTAMVNDAVVLVNYFREQAWAPGATRTAVPLGPNAVALFVAEDPAGTAVEIDVQGVQYDQQVNGKTVSGPQPKGSAALLLLYTRDIAHPDIRRLPRGAF